MKIGICNDHAGVDYKNNLTEYLTSKGYEVVNFGTDTPESIDYPDVAHPLAEAVETGKVDLGIAFCGTGNGMAMTLNKHQGIRAGICTIWLMLLCFLLVSFLMRLLWRLQMLGLQRSSRAAAIRTESPRCLASKRGSIDT